MKPLLEYSKNGYHFALQESLGQFAIFKGTKPQVSAPNWEVVRLRVTPAGSRIISDPKTGTETKVEWEDHERAPGDNEWGLHGFTCLTLEDAQSKLSLLNAIPPTL